MKYSKDFYQKIIEASHDEICVSDKNGVIIFCNKSFEENYGISKSEMIGKNVEYLENHGYATKSPIPLVIRNSYWKKFTNNSYTSFFWQWRNWIRCWKCKRYNRIKQNKNKTADHRKRNEQV